jgi:hypothetical protein
LTIGGIEAALEKAYPEFSTRRAFTSQIIIDHVKKRDNEVIDNVKEALDRAVANGVKTLAVVPTHLMNGLEYNDLIKEVGSHADAFETAHEGLVGFLHVLLRDVGRVRVEFLQRGNDGVFRHLVHVGGVDIEILDEI